MTPSALLPALSLRSARRSRPLPGLLLALALAGGAFAQVVNDRPSRSSERIPLQNPPAMPALPAGGPAGPTITEVPDAPSPRELWKRYVDASGGLEAMRGSGSRRTKGTIQIPGAGMTGTVETLAKAPHKVLVISTLGQFGQMQQGFDGSIGWADDMMNGPRLLEGAELDSFRRDAAYDGPFGYLDEAREARTLGTATFNGAECWVVELTGVMGSDLTCFLDRKDHLLRSVRTVTDTPMGRMPVETVMAEYGTFGSVKVPSRWVIKVMMQEFTWTVNEVSWEEIPDSAFEAPPAVKALIETKKSGGAPAVPAAPETTPPAPPTSPSKPPAPPRAP